jgi:hypothetical protein
LIFRIAEGRGFQALSDKGILVWAGNFADTKFFPGDLHPGAYDHDFTTFPVPFFMGMMINCLAKSFGAVSYTFPVFTSTISPVLEILFQH